jgi:hypothetical protein
MTTTRDNAQAHALVDELLGAPDETADRAVAVLHAHAAALTWVRDATRHYPAPPSVARALAVAAERLRTDEDDRDPVAVLGQTAIDALAAHREAAAA